MAKTALVLGTTLGINNFIHRVVYEVILVGRSLYGMLLEMWKVATLTLTKKSVQGF